jgi:predicted N-formylglutamate amidohydrolase
MPRHTAAVAATNSHQTLSSVEIIPGAPDAGLILICDHASNAVPETYYNKGLPLGLPPSEFERHIAFDRGAATVTRRLATALGAPAILSCYSRLLIDVNRGADDPTLIMPLSDGSVVPGNAYLDAHERERRVSLYYDPYHQAIEEAVDAAIASGKPPAIFSVHSFTNMWRGRPRPWRATILWDKDPRLALPVLDALRQEPNMVTGENEPYCGGMKGDSLYRHATVRGLANALIEIRKDLIRTEQGQAEWAARLALILRRLLASPRADSVLHKIRYYGSRADDAERPAELCLRTTREEEIMRDIDPKSALEIEAQVFRRLVGHLRERVDVQNIELMNLAGFCRNCLANWYLEAASQRGLDLNKAETREMIYGMPYDEWKARHQIEASAEELERFALTRPDEGR